MLNEQGDIPFQRRSRICPEGAFPPAGGKCYLPTNDVIIPLESARSFTEL